MGLLLIIALVVALYARTLGYNYIIDDNVKREGYMYEVPLTAPPPDFFDTRPSKWYRAFMIGMHCVNVSIIYMLWGWCPALLFAVHPMGVWGTAWVTGNYYATTAYFTLISYLLLHTFPNAWGALAAMPIFAAALNSTICAINFPFIFLFIQPAWGLAMFLPLGAYLTGKKFKTGIKIRYSFHENKKLVDTKFTWRRLVLMIKVVGRYTYTAVVPSRLGLFTPFGHTLRDNQALYDHFHAVNKNFWASLGLIVGLFVLGLMVNPVGAFWFFGILSLHSQFNLTGQFYAQRYLYLPLVGLCIVVGQLIAPYPVVVAVIVTFLVIRTHLFIPAFRNQEMLLRNDLENYPEYSQSYNNMAQFYLNKHPLPAWRINEVACYLLRARDLEPESWEIEMNLACFFAMTNQVGMARTHTARSLELLRPLGGLRHPVDMLENQLKSLDAVIADIQQKQAVSGATLSPEKPGQSPEKVGRENGQRTSVEAAEGIVESVGDSKLDRREAGVGVDY